MMMKRVAVTAVVFLAFVAATYVLLRWASAPVHDANAEAVVRMISVGVGGFALLFRPT